MALNCIYLDYLTERPELKDRALGHIVASVVEALVGDRGSRKKIESFRVFQPQAFGDREPVYVGTRASLFRSNNAVEYLRSVIGVRGKGGSPEKESA